MKKVLSLILAAVMLLGSLSITASAADSEGLDYELNGAGDGYIVTGIGTCTDTNLVIPATYNGKPVTAIGYGAFDDYWHEFAIESVSMPSVTTIGENAFQYCDKLTSVDMPNATTIEENAFEHCEYLTSVNMPHVTTVGNRAFLECSSLSSIIMTDVITIGNFAFEECSGLSSINMPYVTTIGSYAFNECTSLSSINMPCVTTIGNYAFKKCIFTSLSLPCLTTIGDGAFFDCEQLADVSLPNVTAIGNDAFGLCRQLTDVSLPNVTTIGNDAFSYCYSFNSITVSDALSSIGTNAVPDGTTVYCMCNSNAKAIKATFENAGYTSLTYTQLEHNFVDGVCTVCGASVPEEDDFLTSFILNKDYNDKYNADTKVTKVSETLTYTIAPLTANAPAFANGGIVTMNVVDGVGAVEVALPAVDKAGEFWYTIKESEGSTAGVTYDESTYYLHLVTCCKDGEYGVVSAQIHLTAPDENGVYVNEASDKIATITNTYAEGKLTVTQEALVNGAPNTEDTFTETVTFTSDKTVTGSITYGDKTITPDMWKNGSVSVDIDLKGGDSIEFNGIPEGVTYTITQKTTADGYDDPTYAIDEEPGDEATETGITGTISDKEDNALIHNEKAIPIDVGVILENGAFILIGLGALTLAAWLVLSRKKEREFAAE